MHFILWVLTYETRAKNINTIQLNTEIATKATTKKWRKKKYENNEDIELRCRTSERMQKLYKK